MPAKAEGGFEKETWLKNKEGKAIHMGQYWHLTEKKWTEEELVKGGKTNIALYPKLVDWDADGDLDLLMGGRKGSVALEINEGTKTDPQFASTLRYVKAGGKNIDHGFHASVDMVDLDGDKLADLVCASSETGITVYKNVGSTKVPKFAEGVVIAKTGEGGPKDYPCVSIADLNGDGKADIVVGAKDVNRKPQIWVYSQK